MKKMLLSAITVIASLGMANSAQAASMFFEAELNGDKIVDTAGNPAPTGSLGTGFATLELNEDMTELAYTLTLDGLGLVSEGGTVTRIHLHTGFPNQRSPFHVLNVYGPADDLDAEFSNLSSTSVTVSGVWDDSDFCYTDVVIGMGGVQTCEGNNDTTKYLSEYVDELIAGGLYWNIHTTTVGTGEIRGNITLAPPPGQNPVSTPEPGTILGLVTLLGLAGINSRKNNA